jgi:putative Ca2+/H+ antiporter (TMEM165/GDT1 family)
MGDKTQLLALVLATRYKKPWTILLGVLIATLVNHGLASWAGAWVSLLVEPVILTWILAVTFFIFGLWILIPDKEEEVKQVGHFGVLMTTVIAFFFAEMGDKTQLATIALGANYSNVVLVTVGTTLGMLGSNALAIFLGQKFLNRVPMLWVRRIACLIFIIFGIAILFRL